MSSDRAVSHPRSRAVSITVSSEVTSKQKLNWIGAAVPANNTGDDSVAYRVYYLRSETEGGQAGSLIVNYNCSIITNGHGYSYLGTFALMYRRSCTHLNASKQALVIPAYLQLPTGNSSLSAGLATLAEQYGISEELPAKRTKALTKTKKLALAPAPGPLGFNRALDSRLRPPEVLRVRRQQVR